LFARARDALAALAGRQPLVLLLDDLHWADPASLDLLRVLARQVPAHPLLLVAAYRVDEITPRHLLFQLLPALVREAAAVRLDLRPLEQQDVRALVAARYPLPPADAARLVAYLLGHAEGNPFYTGELLRTLEEERLLRPGEPAGWALGDLARVRVPPLLRQVIAGRLARLGGAAERLLAVAAVLGQEVPLDLWLAVAGADEEALGDLLERAGEAHVLEEAPDGTAVRFAHALLREALYEGALPLRRRVWHRRAAEALLAAPAPDPDAVAYHLRQAGDPRAAEWLIRAGGRARRAHAWLTAAERYQAALALLGGGEAHARLRAELLIHLAGMGHYTDRPQALAHLDEAARLAAAAGDPALAACAAFERGLLRCLVGERRRGLAEMTAALAALEGLPQAARAGLPTPAPAHAAPGDDYHRQTLVEQLAFVGRFAEARALADGTVVHEPAWAYAARGEPAEARRVLAEARAFFQAAGLHVQAGMALLNEVEFVGLPYEADRAGERRRVMAEAERAFARAGGRQGLPQRLPRMIGLAVPLLEGRWAEARALAQAALASFQERRQLHAREVLGQLARARGDRAEAWRQVRLGLPEGPAIEPGDSFFLPTLAVQRLAIEVALDAGDLPAARAWLACRDRWLTWSGAVLGRAEGQLGWAAYHRAAGDLALAREHAAQALAHAAEPRQPLALLAAHRLLGELDTEAGRYDDAAAHLEQALALADA
ncbi:MAG TPA: AAA family ATPase, partial [Vicinamibacteria bacterium]